MATKHQAHIGWDDLNDLARRFHPKNPKAHNLAAIDASVERFGFVAPVVVNDLDGQIVAGHGRVEALRDRRQRGAPPPEGLRVGPRGEWLVPTVHGVGLTAEDALAYIVADNRTGELGGWDDSRLAEVLAELKQTASGLDGVGYSVADLSELLEALDRPDHASPADPDEIPEAPAEEDLYVQAGQVWGLGQHRVLCGDATRANDVQRLMGSRRAVMGFCDPPYGIDYQPQGRRRRQRGHPPIANDALDPVAFRRFVAKWAVQLLHHVDGAAYVAMASRQWPVVAAALEAAGGHWSGTIVWAKHQFVMSRGDYHTQHELLWYGWRRGVGRYWSGDRTQSDVWMIPRPAVADLHPTMKPVALVERAIRNSSPPGSVVLDLFLGSGTTLVAAERLGRRCLGMELEPRYVQVSIERWQRLTGRSAHLEEA